MPYYNSGKRDLLQGAVSLSADAVNGLLRVILVSGSYTPDIDAHTRYRDVSAHEVNVADPGRIVNYFAGGQALSASVSFTTDTTNDRGTFDAADLTWVTATIAARYAIILKQRNGGSDKENDNLVTYIDFGSTQSSSSGNFAIQWHANGILGLA